MQQIFKKSNKLMLVGGKFLFFFIIAQKYDIE